MAVVEILHLLGSVTMNNERVAKQLVKLANELVAGTSPEALKFDKLKAEAKKLGDYLFKTQMPNYDQIGKKIKSIAKRMIKTGMVLGDTNKKNLEQLSRGRFNFSENRAQNPYAYSVGLLIKAGNDYYTGD